MRTGLSQQTDYSLFVYYGVILIIGLIILTSAGTAVGHQRFGDSYFFIKKQMLLGVLPGIILFYALSRINYSIFYNNYLLVYCVIILSLVVVFVPGVGTTLGTGAKSWLKIGSYTLQTSELAKLLLTIFFAAYLTKKGSGLKDFKTGFLPALGLGLAPVGLVALQPDIGTASIIFAIVFGMLFAANARLYHLFLLLVAGSAVFIYLIVSSPYRADRLTIFLHPELDPLGKGYHINQAMLAIGSGGIFGTGLGHSRQKFDYLPEVQADSIFAVMGEEMGFIFTAGFILLLMIAAGKSLRLAKKTPDGFGRYLVVGIVIWFVAQSFLNIGAMIGLLPLTGVPLPFVSHGGTALLIAMGALGMLVSVSKFSHQT